ncbi:hypothetical protein GRX03_05085 [Halovenus sp. WSH3]|uniref:Uncharacterized protein n=1 Tax=Halovenus carboxidivorans TaxID=2692199 RepID=A0A6B0T6T9_9EURY|nr:hypothetical protein [Halovenus carboxidivorans]MXR50982.1 hypothetical protein [Halovenus carboxidivorans]
MGFEEFNREEIPTEGVSIGGDDDCDHETYRRYGSDVGGNIYFQCTSCSNVILNYDTTDSRGREPEELARESPNDDGPTPDPLVTGLSVDSDDSDDARRPEGDESESILSVLVASIRRRL